MNTWRVKTLMVLCTSTVACFAVYAQEPPWTPDSLAMRVHTAQQSDIPPNARQLIQLLDFKNTDLKDIVRSLATKYNLNIFVDDKIQQKVTIRLSEIQVHDALQFIVKENGLALTLEDAIYKISLPEVLTPEPKTLRIQYENNLLSLDLHEDELNKVVQVISEKTGQSIVLNQGVDGKLSGFLHNIPLQDGLYALLTSNGFGLRMKGGIFYIEKREVNRESSGKGANTSFWISVQDSLITLDVAEAELSRIVRELSIQTGNDVFLRHAGR